MDHGKTTISESLSAVAAQLKADDNSFRTAVVVRDKQRPYDEPTVIRAMSVQEVKDFVDGIPDQVHYLVLSHGEANAFAKISLSAKTGKYNVFCDSLSFLSKTFDSEFLSQLAPAFPEEIRDQWKQFLFPVEEV